MKQRKKEEKISGKTANFRLQYAKISWGNLTSPEVYIKCMQQHLVEAKCGDKC